MIRRLDKRNYRCVRMVIDTEPEQTNPYCSTCAAVGKLSRLKNRIYLDDKGKLLPPGPDADQWLMCWTCGLIIPAKDVKLEGKISGVQGVEPVANPFEIKKAILGVDSRHRYQRLKQRRNKHPDPEVDKELRQGNTVTDYSTTDIHDANLIYYLLNLVNSEAKT